jgi:DNA recombination protein RmuC
MAYLWFIAGLPVGAAAAWMLAALRAAPARAEAEARRRAAEDLLAQERAGRERERADLRTELDRARDDLKNAFKALSTDTLREAMPHFLRQAEETFAKFQKTAAGDLDVRREQIAGMLKPLEENLKLYQARLQQSESGQSAALGQVRKQLEALAQQSQTLADETQRFRMVLHSSQTRGRWGEETLRRVVEAAGMSKHCDFVEQTGAGEGRPDMIVKLPGGRSIVVDAKVPSLEFLDDLESADPERRAPAMQQHAAKLKETIRDLARRNYHAQVEGSLDYVVLFVPAESLFSAALEGDRGLIVWAAEQRIMLATPASLIALLRCVALTWQQFQQSENAREIVTAAQEFYNRVTVFTEHFARIGQGLNAANKAFNEAQGSYQRRVRPKGEELAALALPAGAKPLSAPPPVDLGASAADT